MKQETLYINITRVLSKTLRHEQKALKKQEQVALNSKETTEIIQAVEKIQASRTLLHPTLSCEFWRAFFANK
jgi:hypothetical protein